MSQEAVKAAATMSQEAESVIKKDAGLVSSMIQVAPVWVWGLSAIFMFILALSLPTTSGSILSWLAGVVLVAGLLFRLLYQHRRD